MVFTWSIESVLIGLISLSVVRDHLMASQLVVSAFTLALNTICAASTLDAYYVVALSHLATISGLLVAALLRPLADIAQMLTLALLLVSELAAMGMVFASTMGGTALFLHPRAIFALLVPAVLEHMACNTIALAVLEGPELAMALAFLLIATQLAPFDVLSTSVGAVICVLVGIMGFVYSKGPIVALALLIALYLAFAGLIVWIPVWFPKVAELWTVLVSISLQLPNFQLPNFVIPSFTSFGLPVFKLGRFYIEAGPWILTFVLSCFAIASLALFMWQVTAGNMMFVWVVGLPIVLIAVWLTLLWLFKPKPPPDSAAPSAPPAHAVTRLRMWPRVFMDKEHFP